MKTAVACGGTDYARHLLDTLDSERAVAGEVTGRSPRGRRWHESGLAGLTGPAAGPPLAYPAPLAEQADAVVAALAALAGRPVSDFPDGATLLSERAQLVGLRRRGAVSAGGSCRLLATLDGRIALNLARGEDRALMPAWLEHDAVEDWAGIAAAVGRRRTDELVARGRLMGLPVAPSRWPDPVPWLARRQLGQPAGRQRRPRIIDLSSLWAGPLCGRLLAACGAEVIKVEDLARPDGARRGNPEFFDRLNGAKSCLSLDLRGAGGRSALLDLIRSADLVIEASRPRALRQLGIDAEELLREVPGLSWLSLTAYGRDAAAADWVGFGDEVGVAAGLSAVLHEVSGVWAFVGDALADPLTGLHAAVAAQAALNRGGGQLIALAMRDVVAHTLTFDLPATAAARRARFRAGMHHSDREAA